MYGAGWKTKLVTGTVLQVIKGLVNNRRTTSVRAKWELAGEQKIVTLRIANVKPKEAPHSNGDQEILTQEASELENIPQELNVTPTEGALSPSTRVSESDITHDGGPVINCHGREWTRANVTMQINGFIKARKWKVIGPIDEIISEGHGPAKMNPLDYFMWMFPQGFLSSIVSYTNENMEDKLLQLTTRGEIVKFFGVLILMTRCEFSARRSLWSTKQSSKYLPLRNSGIYFHVSGSKRYVRI